MQYKSISADGHVNEPPELWVKNLPEKFRDRGPRVIETPNTKGHAWIMEGQTRPSVMGFSSMYFRSSKRFDRASLVEGFKQIKDRGVRYEDLFPGSYDPAARVEEILEDSIDAEVIFNGVGTVWTGIKLCPDKELALACYQRLQRLDRRLPGVRARAVHLQRHAADHRAGRRHRRAAPLRGARPAHRPARVVSERVVLGPVAGRRSILGRGGRARDADQRAHPVLLPRRRPRFEDHRRRSAGRSGARQAARPRRPGRQLPGDPVADDAVGRVRALPGSEVRRIRSAHRVGSVLPRAVRRLGAAQPARTGTSRCCPASTSARTRPVVYIVDEVGAHNRYDIGVANIMWGPDFPHSSSAWPVDYELGLRDPQAGGCQRERDRAHHVEERGRHLQAARTKRATRSASRRDRRKKHGCQQRIQVDLGRFARARAARRSSRRGFRRACATARRSSSPTTAGAPGRWTDEPVPLPPTAATGSGWHRAADGPLADGPVSWDAVLPALYDPAERVRAQWSDSVDGEILYPVDRPVGRDQAARRRRAQARAGQDVQRLDRRVLRARSRTVCSGWRSCRRRASQDAQDELLRCVNELGLRGAVLDAWPSGAPTGGNPADEPFWETVNDLRVPISLHFGVGPTAITTPRSGIAPGLRPPMADALLPMVAAGVFDRYPDVKIVFAHGDAGWALHWMEFFDINYVRHKHLAEYALKDPDAVPSEYMRRHAWFTFHQDRPAVKNRHRLGGVHLHVGEPLPVRRLELARQPPAGHAGHRRGAARRAAGAARRQRRSALPAARVREGLHE